jgi:hypothetical protein
LPSRLAALHTGDDVHEYLCDENWTTKVLKHTQMTWPTNSTFSTGKFCLEDVTVSTHDKDSVGQTLQRSMHRTHANFGTSWLKHEREGINKWH